MNQKRMMNYWREFYLFLLMLLSLFLSSNLCACSVIDEDLSGCENNAEVVYDVEVSTNLSMEIQTELTLRLETELAEILYDSLKNIFREYAHDIDLSFYTDNQRRYHMQHVMDAGEASYKLTLPANKFEHLALANIQEERKVEVVDDDIATDCYLYQKQTTDTVSSHNTSLFSARADIDVKGNVSQTFNVKLFMVNCAAVLVMKTHGVAYKNMKTFYTGLGNGFYVQDSTFTFQPKQVLNTRRLMTPPAERECFYALSFPSHDTAEEAQSATRIDRQVSKENSIWEMHLYVTMPDDHVVETKLFIHEPLQAGQVMIIFTELKSNGEVLPLNSEVGSSVNLNWKPGLHF